MGERGELVPLHNPCEGGKGLSLLQNSSTTINIQSNSIKLSIGTPNKIIQFIKYKWHI